MRRKREHSIHGDPGQRFLDRSYSYQPIDTTQGQIRLIRLLKNLSPNGLVQCDVRAMNLSTKPRYRAISYVWGPETPTREIDITGTRYTIRENLWQFLNLFREATENDSFLWIDQIAIDQHNLSERNHQVQLMGSIFGNAFQVISWLGWPSLVHVGVETAVQAHKNLYNHSTLMWETCLTWRARSGLICPICERHFQDASSEAGGVTRKALTDLLGNPYWTRLWITQEIVLAKDIIFVWGQDRLSPSDIQQYCASFGLAELDPILNHVESLLRMRVTPLKHPDDGGFALNQLLMTICPADLKCADSRDLIFGILGIVRTPDRVLVDYSLAVGELCGLLLDRTVLSADSSFDNPHLLSTLAVMVDRLGLSLLWEEWLDYPGEGYRSMLRQDRLVAFAHTLRSLEEGGLVRYQWPTRSLGRIVSATLQYRRCRNDQGDEYHRLPKRLVEGLVTALGSKLPQVTSAVHIDRSEHPVCYFNDIEEIIGGSSCEVCTYSLCIDQLGSMSADPETAHCSGSSQAAPPSPSYSVPEPESEPDRGRSPFVPTSRFVRRDNLDAPCPATIRRSSIEKIHLRASSSLTESSVTPLKISNARTKMWLLPRPSGLPTPSTRSADRFDCQ